MSRLLDFPAEHWQHIRTSNPIESTFSPVRARTNVTRGAGSRTAAFGMAFKLIQAAEGNWRKVNAPHLVALVAAGTTFINGKLVERAEAPIEEIESGAAEVAA
jgi:transposase-like protein